MPYLNQEFSVGLSNSDFNLSNYGNDSLAIIAGINKIQNSVKSLLLKSANYQIANTSNIKLSGKNYIYGQDNVNLYGGKSYDWSLDTEQNKLKNSFISKINFDLNFVENASGFKILGSKNSYFQNLKFKNGASGGWFLFIGAEPSNTTNDINSDLYISDCIFDNHSGSLEQLLVFNAKKIYFSNCKFKNKPVGPTVGLWQKCNEIYFIDCEWENCGIPFYYSLTCDNIFLTNPKFINCGGIQGANISDNGTFGVDRVNNLVIDNPQFIGGSLSQATYALQIGSVNNFKIFNPYIENYLGGILFSVGNTGATIQTYPSQNGIVTSPTFKNLYKDVNYKEIHNAFYFGKSGDLNIQIYGGNIIDDNEKLKYPVSFNSGGNYSNIKFFGTNLNFANGGKKYILNDLSTIDSSVEFVN